MLETVSALVESGAIVTVAIPSEGPLVAEVERRGATAVICVSPVLRKSVMRPTGALRFVRDAAVGFAAGVKLLRRIRPQVLYVNTVTIPLWLGLARLTRIPAICHVHEAESAAPRLIRWVLAAPLLLAHRVISNSEHCISVTSGTFPTLKSRSSVVRNPVAGPSSPAVARARLDGALRVLYVGRLSERKGVDVAVRAVSELRRTGTAAELDIVGDVFPGYEWYLASLHDLVETLGLHDAVHFHGYQNDIWPHLGASDVVVVPSRLEEGFGNTAVEGILAGRPVLVSDTSGLREASAGFETAQRVPPGDVGALATKLSDVAARWPDMRLGAASDQRLANERYNPALYRAGIVESVHRLVGNGSPGISRLPLAPPVRRKHAMRMK